ncbi:MAG TPA: type II toxin-antitoxin system Phd/YefM family antitoxin [Planctomycetota bacterium]|nr:type II toxin-antitoxin system Phd/YefM family antitoxin [Planctomycetota bacterium]
MKTKPNPKTGAAAGTAKAPRKTQLGPGVSFPASVAKNQFGQVLDAALERGEVVITKHDEPKAVLMSMEAYRALKGPVSPALEELREEWDLIVERMQAPSARAARDALFQATPEELGRHAVDRARKKARG